LPIADEFSRVSEKDRFYESNVVAPAPPPPRNV
jgi:hypothetical protein